MVVKKYLCAAPRRELWDSKAEALLKSLNGDTVKREQVARQTLAMLKERHKHEKKRSGPGRKSNAEHAIAFYEYLVTADDGSRESSEDESASRPDNTGASDEDDQTIDTQEFLNQHDNVCDVCNLGGELICCSTCTLVFHEECLRPVLKSIPSDWSCPHCITQGVKNYKRHSKTWKAAASGIRQMNRLKMDREQESEQSADNIAKDKDEDTPIGGDSIKAEGGVEDASKSRNKSAGSEVARIENNEPDRGNNSDVPESLKSDSVASERASREERGAFKNQDSHSKNLTGSAATSVASSVSASAGNEARRDKSLRKIGDSSTADSTDNILVRGRRQRKQPSLYRPQMCADSRWKSDEKQLIGRSTDRSDSDDVKSRISHDGSTDDTSPTNVGDQIEDKIIICVTANSERKGDGDGPFCNFCNDDTAIPLCVFCGCRVCFGKHDRSNLLLCDNCDDEYHTKCLGLSRVPATKEWYCPSCDRSKKNRTSIDSMNSKVHSTRRALKAVVDSIKKGKATTPMCMAKSPTSSNISTRRSRSRSPKFETDQDVSQRPLSPRKRIQTPKAASNATEAFESQTHQRKRRRPSKSVVTNGAISSPSSSRKRGRLTKTVTTPDSSSPNTSQTSTGSPRKRGGRQVKTVVESDDDNVEQKEKKNGSKHTMPTVPVLATPKSRSGTESTKSESHTKPNELTKVVSRVSGRTVKRACFHDEVDEGEQHLRSTKSLSSSSSTNHQQTSATNVVSGSHKNSSKNITKLEDRQKTVSSPSQPVRKKQKVSVVEEKADVSSQSANAPIVSSTVDFTSQKSSEKVGIKQQHSNSKSTTDNDKDGEMSDPPSVAPVRMKLVLEPPAPIIRPQESAQFKDQRPTIEGSEGSSFVSTSAKNNENSNVIPSVMKRGNAKDMHSGAKPTVPATVAPKLKKAENSTTEGENKNPSHPQKASNKLYDVNEPPIASLPTQQASKTTENAKVTKTASIHNSRTPNTSKSTFATTAMPYHPSNLLLDPVALEAAIKALPDPITKPPKPGTVKQPRRKPGARECMQISRRFGVHIIPEKYMKTLLDYCKRGKVEHLIKMRERLDCHSRYLESQLAGLEALIEEVGESQVVVPPMPHSNQPRKEATRSHPQQQQQQQRSTTITSSTRIAAPPPASSGAAPKNLGVSSGTGRVVQAMAKPRTVPNAIHSNTSTRTPKTENFAPSKVTTTTWKSSTVTAAGGTPTQHKQAQKSVPILPAATAQATISAKKTT